MKRLQLAENKITGDKNRAIYAAFRFLKIVGGSEKRNRKGIPQPRRARKEALRIEIKVTCHSSCTLIFMRCRYQGGNSLEQLP